MHPDSDTDPMILFVGIATNKLPRADLPLDDAAQPWLMSIAAELTAADHFTATTALFNRAVRLPKGVSVQEGAEGVHGISTRTGRRSGCTQRWIAYGLLELLNEADVAVTYGDMMRKVFTSVIMREAGSDAQRWLAQLNRTGIEWVDLRTSCTEICKLPNTKSDIGGYRWPSRAEAAESVLDADKVDELEEEAGYGAAWQNMRTEKALFFALQAKNIIEVAA